MSKSKGYVVRLNEQREEAFEHKHYESFGEPVPEFNHSRNIPLICFVISSQNILTHIALGKRGNLAGTDVRRLNLNDIFELTSIVKIDQLVDSSPNRIKNNVSAKLGNGGLISPKSFEFLLNKISKLAPETASILSKYSEARTKRIKSLPPKIKDTLAEQKEAVATAMTIAGIDRGELQGWDVTENQEPTSFLDGLEQVRLREDPMVINDLTTLPGYKTLKTTPLSSVVFENDKSKLTVVLANRLPRWDVTENQEPTSFLDGLEQVRLREDPMVINDLTTLPGYKTLKTTPLSSVVFENDKSKLTVVLANRLPLEQQLGVDLIYYNETFSCFLMIQYKAMEKEGDDAVYRFPNTQLTEEINRMDGVLSELKKVPSKSEVDGFRLNESPFFLKMCPRIVFNPDNYWVDKRHVFAAGVLEASFQSSDYGGATRW